MSFSDQTHMINSYTKQKNLGQIQPSQLIMKYDEI
jgi:hypothetical protein